MNRQWFKKTMATVLSAVLALGCITVVKPAQTVSAAYEEEHDEWYYYYENANFSLSTYAITLFPKETFQVHVGNVGKVTYKSQNTKIATVNSKGVIKGVKTGKTYIEVSCKYGTRYVYVEVVKNQGQYMDTITKYDFPITTEKTITEYDRFILKIDSGLYVAEDLPQMVDAIMKGIEKHTGFSFYPGVKGEIPSDQKIVFEAVHGYSVEPCGGSFGITVDDICLVGDEISDQLFCLVHELIHTVQYRNTDYAGFLAEGYSEVHVDEIMSELPYQYGTTEAERCGNYVIYWDESYCPIDVALTAENVEEIYLKTFDEHGASYWLVKYIREKYGEETLKKMLKGINDKKIAEDRAATFAYLKSVTKESLFQDFCKWYNKQEKTDGSGNYSQQGKDEVHYLEIDNLTWTDSSAMYSKNYKFSFEDEVIFDWSESTAYMQNVQGKKIPGYSISYGNGWDDSLEGTATLYDVEGNELETLGLNEVSNYFSLNAVRIKIESTGEHTALFWVRRSDISEYYDEAIATPQAKSAEKKHIHTIPKLINKKSATYTEKGYSGDYVCKKCNYVFQKGKSVAKLTLKAATKVTAKNTTASAVNVSWSSNTKATGYEIQYSKDANFKKGVKKVTIKSSKSTSRVIKDLKKNSVYYVRIRCYKMVKDADGKSVTVRSSWVTKRVAIN